MRRPSFFKWPEGKSPSLFLDCLNLSHESIAMSVHSLSEGGFIRVEMIVYSLVCKMLPNRDGEVKLRMDHRIFLTEEEATEASMSVIRQNLPFRAHVVSFTMDEELIKYLGVS